ncbi:MAG: hypothetical protein R3C70_05710 [Geminicoccaceae bacterium]
MPDLEKTGFLTRLFDGDAHVESELRALVRQRLRSETDTDAPQIAGRTVGDLWARAQTIRQAREHALAEKAAAERSRCEEEAERSSRVRLNDIARRGESVWREVETEIERRNASGYDKATNLLRDLMTISREKGTFEKFSQRLQEIRDRHARKERLIERLVKLG